MKTFLFGIVVMLQFQTHLYAQADASATAETKSLYCYLLSLKGSKLIIGQQYSTYSLQHLKDPTCVYDTSDCLMSVGSHPALLGVDYNKDSAINDAHIKNIYRHGGIATMHWPMVNPIKHDSAQDPTPAVDSILPGGSKNAFYKLTLDTLASFCHNLLDDSGKLIPVIFRPFHENLGNNYWWSAGSCSAADYKSLYRYTVSYLRDTLGVHNLLYAYAPNRPADYLPELYSARYPGDKYVDIIGFDRYNTDGANYTNLLLQDCDTVVRFAEARGKVAAITESGVKNGVNNTAINSWFTTQFLNPLLGDTVARKVAYWLTWSNGDSTSYWVPLPWQHTYHSYDSMYNNPYTLYLNRLPGGIYNGTTCRGAFEPTAVQQVFTQTAAALSLYPDPATQVLNISSSISGVAEVLLTDVLGRKLQHAYLQNGKVAIDVSALPAGVYIIMVSNAGVQKFIKQ